MRVTMEGISRQFESELTARIEPIPDTQMLRGDRDEGGDSYLVPHLPPDLSPSHAQRSNGDTVVLEAGADETVYPMAPLHYCIALSRESTPTGPLCTCEAGSVDLEDAKGVWPLTEAASRAAQPGEEREEQVNGSRCQGTSREQCAWRDVDARGRWTFPALEMLSSLREIADGWQRLRTTSGPAVQIVTFYGFHKEAIDRQQSEHITLWRVLAASTSRFPPCSSSGQARGGDAVTGTTPDRLVGLGVWTAGIKQRFSLPPPRWRIPGQSDGPELKWNSTVKAIPTSSWNYHESGVGFLSDFVELDVGHDTRPVAFLPCNFSRNGEIGGHPDSEMRPSPRFTEIKTLYMRIRRALRQDLVLYISRIKLRNLQITITAGILPERSVTILLATRVQGWCGAHSQPTRVRSRAHRGDLPEELRWVGFMSLNLVAVVPYICVVMLWRRANATPREQVMVSAPQKRALNQTVMLGTSRQPSFEPVKESVSGVRRTAALFKPWCGRCRHGGK
ncbi:hypothetical protein CERSUDRAFT_74104 [Gelatoporia subvermispora B]|uniref:Uncharacterized protein n=1 Tax=Ceriporiopsis subvermispora (strain B) TaxID=914234 RepID=M2QJ87_CERS8|nr:hypothetical protein CERSUDRAFT_74104 [Gelatoporia subvermispora B]